MNWDTLDFTVFGAMLLGVGVVYFATKRKTDDAAYRMAVGVALAAAFLLVWVNGAVGIIGAENNDANSMFFGVLAVALIGSFIARFQARGMMLVFCATALAQALVAVVALIGRMGSATPLWPRDILMLTGFFVFMWLLSAWLFRNAARSQFALDEEPKS